MRTKFHIGRLLHGRKLFGRSRHAGITVVALQLVTASIDGWGRQWEHPSIPGNSPPERAIVSSHNAKFYLRLRSWDSKLEALGQLSAAQESETEILDENPAEGEYMQRIHRYLGSLVLGAAFVAPMVIAASPLPQDRKEEKQEDKKEQRYYDRDRKDYHTWDTREDASYRRWLEEKHYQTDRAFSRMKSKEQSEYWKWRHEHPDHDADRH